MERDYPDVPTPFPHFCPNSFMDKNREQHIFKFSSIMAYTSSEFPINQGLNNYNEFQSAATVFNENLVVMTSWGLENGIDLVQTVFPLKDLIAQSPDDPTEPVSDQGLKASANWTSTDIVQNAQSAKPALAALPSNNPDTLFTFYCSEFFLGALGGGTALSGILSIRYPTNDQDISKNNQWGKPIMLLDSDGATMPVPAPNSRDICTTVIGDNIVLVSCASAQPFHKAKTVNFDGFQNIGTGTFFGVYDKTKIDFNKNEWTAEYSTYIPYNVGFGFHNTNTDRVLMEWFNRVSSAGVLEYYVLVLTMNTSKDQLDVSRKIAPFMAPMTISEKGTVTVGAFDGAVMQPFSNPPAPYFMATLQRDPTGRLRSWFSAGNNSLTAYTLEIDGNMVNMTPTSNTISPSEVSNNSVSPSAALIYMATAGYYQGTTPATKPGSPDLKTDNYPVYEFVFYGRNPKCLVKRLATVQVVADPDDNQREVSLQYSKDDPAPVFVIGGIINGPIPYPLENYKTFDPGSTEAHAGTLTYGTNDQTILERKVEKSVSIGFEEEIKTTKGVGPNFKLALHAGMGSVQEASSSLDFIKNFTQDANIIYDPNHQNPSSDSLGMIKKMRVNIQITAYSYLDNYGQSVISTGKVTAKGGMGAASIQIGFTETGDFIRFQPFDVIQGDLTSYMADAINKRMVEELGYKGSKYGYADDNYFGDVICQNALPMGDQDYLEMTWDTSGTFTSGFSEMQASFKESSWNYDGSLYAGIGGGAGFELFGLGEEMEFSAMAGADLSRDFSTSEERETEWGIEISEPWGPPSPGVGAGPKSVEHFSFRIYFLPVPVKPSILPPNHWTQELFDFLPADNEVTPQIDKNSACWKICFVVTEIQYKDGTTLSHNASLDKPSVY